MTTNRTIGLKRKRDRTFVASEKMALIELVDQHFAIVESMKTDAASIKQKTIEWQKIAEEFNAASPIHHRDWTVLKTCWENMKKKAKSEQSACNQHYLGTGGGPPRKQKLDPTIQRVLELIQSRLSGYANQFDLDGVHFLTSGSNVSVAITKQDPLFSNDSSTSESQVQDTNRETTEATETTATIAVDCSQYSSRSPSPEASETRIEPSPQHQKASTTPTRACLSSHAIPAAVQRTSRRKPTLNRNREASDQARFNAQRISSLLKADAHAAEEHAINLNILQENYKQAKLKTAQEEIKLEILKIELNKLQN